MQTKTATVYLDYRGRPHLSQEDARRESEWGIKREIEELIYKPYDYDHFIRVRSLDYKKMSENWAKVAILLSQLDQYTKEDALNAY